jgi:hypothetical protein
MKGRSLRTGEVGEVVLTGGGSMLAGACGWLAITVLRLAVNTPSPPLSGIGKACHPEVGWLRKPAMSGLHQSDGKQDGGKSIIGCVGEDGVMPELATPLSPLV